MKQTAVEWLVERITKQHDKEFDSFYRAEIEQAKQMEKQQIIDAYDDGYSDSDNGFIIKKKLLQRNF